MVEECVEGEVVTIVGGVVDLALPDTRLLWWAAAALLETAGTWTAHLVPGRSLDSEQLAFDADHMLERMGLFFIITLGQVVLVTGTAIDEAHDTGVMIVRADGGDQPVGAAVQRISAHRRRIRRS
ncbi:low temperature requirement protein A [Nocardia sp. NBC_01730]|nr:low temperature requirement protein A [Nocardia sp. NBC_01730]